MQFWAFLDLKLRHYCSWDWVATTCPHKLSPKSCHPPKFNLFVFQNLDFTNLTFLRLGWFLAAGGLQRQVPQLINPKLLSYHGTATPPAALLAIWSKPGPKCDTLSTNLTKPVLIWPVFQGWDKSDKYQALIMQAGISLETMSRIGTLLILKLSF